MPGARIPVLLIIGATGAGKTTLVSRLLAQRPHDERRAVLVNDFGTTTLNDPALATERGVTVREVAGCICCTAHVALRTALIALLREARPQRLLIEASAAARPAALLRVLSEPGLAGSIDLRRTICVVEPRQLADARYASNDVYREQIAAADAIVIGGERADREPARAAIENMPSARAAYFDLATADLSGF